MSFTDLGIKDANQLAAFLAEVLPPRALQYARTASDQMRVVVDTLPAGTTTMLWGNVGNSPTWYASGAPTALDAREEQRERSFQTFNSRRSAWSFS